MDSFDVSRFIENYPVEERYELKEVFKLVADVESTFNSKDARMALECGHEHGISVTKKYLKISETVRKLAKSYYDDGQSGPVSDMLMAISHRARCVGIGVRINIMNLACMHMHEFCHKKAMCILTVHDKALSILKNADARERLAAAALYNYLTSLPKRPEDKVLEYEDAYSLLLKSSVVWSELKNPLGCPDIDDIPPIAMNMCFMWIWFISVSTLLERAVAEILRERSNASFEDIVQRIGIVIFPKATNARKREEDFLYNVYVFYQVRMYRADPPKYYAFLKNVEKQRVGPCFIIQHIQKTHATQGIMEDILIRKLYTDCRCSFSINSEKYQEDILSNTGNIDQFYLRLYALTEEKQMMLCDPLFSV